MWIIGKTCHGSLDPLPQDGLDMVNSLITVIDNLICCFAVLSEPNFSNHETDEDDL